MPHQRKNRIVAAIASVTFALLVQYIGLKSGVEFYNWWLIPNIVPYLIGFGADVVLGIPPDPIFYVAIVLQWALLGVLFGDLYTKYVQPQVS
jgi:uncharacterized protein YebE (UPF0316 family)